MFDVGSGDMALEESAGASVAQADWLTVTDAERGQHQGQHGDDLGVHGVGGRARRRLQSWAARGHRGGPRVGFNTKQTVCLQPPFPYPDAKAGDRGTGCLAGYLAPKGIRAAPGPSGTARCPRSTTIQGLLCLDFESRRMGD